MSGSTALRLAATDNVATALRDLEAGEVVEIEDQRIELLERTPLCHKLALADLAPGTPVTKYGQPIGRTTTAVALPAHRLVAAGLEAATLGCGPR